MTRVVLHSNVFISSLVFGGNPRRLIQLAEQGSIELFTSQLLCREVERVLATKFGWSARTVVQATSYLWSLAQLVEPRKRVIDCTDPDDNHVLECALEAQADWLITGDHHLLVMHPLSRNSNHHRSGVSRRKTLGTRVAAQQPPSKLISSEWGPARELSRVGTLTTPRSRRPTLSPNRRSSAARPALRASA